MLSPEATKRAINLLQSIGNCSTIFATKTLFEPGTKEPNRIIIVNPRKDQTCDAVLINILNITTDQLQQFEDYKHHIDSIKIKGIASEQNITVLGFYNEK